MGKNTSQWTELDKSKPADKQQQIRTCQLRSRLLTYTSCDQKNHGSGQTVSCYEMLHSGYKQQLTISAWYRPNVATEWSWVNQSPAAEEQSRWEAARSHTIPLLWVAILLQHPVNEVRSKMRVCWFKSCLQSGHDYIQVIMWMDWGKDNNPVWIHQAETHSHIPRAKQRQQQHRPLTWAFLVHWRQIDGKQHESL